MAHDWEMDAGRSSLAIGVLVWRCKTCGVLRIRKGGVNAPPVYRRNPSAGSPFERAAEEPPCRASPTLHAATVGN